MCEQNTRERGEGGKERATNSFRTAEAIRREKKVNTFPHTRERNARAVRILGTIDSFTLFNHARPRVYLVICCETHGTAGKLRMPPPPSVQSIFVLRIRRALAPRARTRSSSPVERLRAHGVSLVRRRAASERKKTSEKCRENPLLPTGETTDAEVNRFFFRRAAARPYRGILRRRTRRLFKRCVHKR